MSVRKLERDGRSGQNFEDAAERLGMGNKANDNPSVWTLKKGLTACKSLLVALVIAISAAAQMRNGSILPEKIVDEPPILTPAKVEVNRIQPKVGARLERPVFSLHPTSQEIFSSQVLGEPLVPIGGKPTDGENAALAQALLYFSDRTSNEDTSSLSGYLRAYPLSPWSPALLCNMGLLYYHTGHFTKAMAAWEKAWSLSKDSQEPAARALADKALGELAKMNARLGRFGRLEILFQEMGDRNVRGSATEKITGAKAGLWLMKNRPEAAFRCGPMALSSIQAFQRPGQPFSREILSSRSTEKGMSLVEIDGLAQQIGMNLQMAKRQVGASILLPAVVHWKVDHYAALLKREGALYLLRDPTFGEDLWMSEGALDSEASGYFLVSKGELPPGWKTVGSAEGGLVFGKGNTGSSVPDATGYDDDKAGGNQGSGPGKGKENGGGGGPGSEPASDSDPGANPPTCGGPTGMPSYAFHSMLASLSVEDIPVGTVPPRGPDALFKISYSQREANQPGNFTYSNMGQKWTFSWLSYIVDDPANANANVSQYLQGGGLHNFKNYQSGTKEYAPEVKTGSILVRVSGSPILYERRLNGGGKEVFSVPNGATSFPRKVFLTKIFNAAGDSLTFNYDNSLRLVSAMDALGQVSMVTYGTGSDSLKIARVTDPFGRYATFEYNGTGQLAKVTDVLGLVSDFRYGSGDFIDSMATPYGTTLFSKGESGTNRWIQAQDALGQLERLEYKDAPSGVSTSESVVPSGLNTVNSFLNYRSSYYWDKKTMKNYAGNFTKARIYHWLHASDINTTGSVLESEKMPLENRVWYNYQNQPSAFFMGDTMSSRPSKIGSVLEDGTTKLYQNEFNRIGLITKTIDPLGRETRYFYDANLIDLISVRKKKGSVTELIDSVTYNSIHLPLSLRDAAGQVSAYTYNSKGQPLTYRNPKGEMTTWAYDSSGYLLKRQGAQAGDTNTYTYDGYGRVRTASSPDGHVLRFDYDAMDRTTKISFPDSSYQQFVYNKLDLEKSRDRRGRWSKIFRNALQQPVAYQDPMLRLTNVEWCGCGKIMSLTDPEGRKTQWWRDIEGRVTDKIYADGRSYHNEFGLSSGRLLSQTDPKGQITQYQYFKDDGLKQVGYANAEHPTATVAYTYDSVYNRLATMTDGLGTTQYKYKAVSGLGALQLDTLDGPWTNDKISFTDDSLGRVVSRSINGSTLSVAYDSLGRMVSDSNALGLFEYRYVGKTNRPDSLLYPNGQRSVFSYFNNAGDFRLQTLDNQDPSSAVISKFDYAYDAQGQIRTWTRRFGSLDTTTYDFVNDLSDQLTAATLKKTLSGNILKSFSYSYDKAGNRTHDQQDSLTHRYTYNNVNQLLTGQGGGKIRFMGTLSEPGTLTVNGNSVPVATDSSFSTLVGVTADTNVVTAVSRDFSNNADTNTYRVVLPNSGNTSYTYDANGNMTSDGSHTFEYDAEDRLTAIVIGTARSEFLYDGYGRRVKIIEKSSGTITSKKAFLWVGNTIAEERDSAGSTVSKRFFWQGVQVGSTKYFYTQDHLGSIRELIDTTGAVVTRYDYDPYGKLTKLSGSMDADFGFTGHFLHVPSGLNLTRYRAYNSGIGRWISRDPLEEDGGDNLYGYVENDPVNLLDELGLAPGDPYPTEDDAGKQAVQDINQTSIQNHQEFSGRVYKNPDGTFSYTPPQPGGKDWSPGAPPAPPGTTKAGRYHTHGANDPGYDNENFSSSDKKNADNDGVPSYLGTPKGKTKKYTPPGKGKKGPGKTKTLCP